MKRAVYVLTILLFLALPGFSKQLAVLPELFNPSMIETTGSEMYILDGAVVHVFSLENFKHLRSFGKTGEGPGEILTSPENPVTMKLCDNYVLLHSFFKMVLYSRDGKLIKEQRIPVTAAQIFPIGNNYVVARYMRNSGGLSKIGVFLYDQGFKELSKLYENALLYNIRKGRLPMPLFNIWIYCGTDRLFVLDQQKHFYIQVFDLHGDRLPAIELDYPKLRVTEEFKKKTIDWLQLQPAYKNSAALLKDMISFTSYLPTIRRCRLSGGKIFVQTYKTLGQLCEFIVLDYQGKVQGKLYLPGADREQMRPNPAATFVFNGNNYYYLVEDSEKEEWQLHVEKIAF